MLSHSQIKFLRSLQISKFRAKENQFLVEGEKLVAECLAGSYNSNFSLLEIFASEDWIKRNQARLTHSGTNSTSINAKQLEQISSFKTPNQVVALIKQTDGPRHLNPDPQGLYLMADKIQDPGNMGTLFRLCEWFGVTGMILSEDSADPLNPKVIQAGMGSVLRVPYLRTDPVQWLKSCDQDMPVYGTLLEGTSLYKINFSPTGVVILGNESKGIRPELVPLITDAVFIPRWSEKSSYPESLNVSTAAAIVLHEIRRK